MGIGKELKNERIFAGLSLGEAAKQANVDASLLAAFEEETEQGLNVHLLTAERIANVYDTTIQVKQR